MTTIEWTEATWNPVTGCSKVSPGCAHCYAENVALRFWPSQYPPVEQPFRDDGGAMASVGRPRLFTDVQCHEDRLEQPLRRRKPTTYFVNSMSDLFHEDVPDAFIDRVFAVMAMAPRHTFQVLTKRADRMLHYCADPHTPLRVYREFAVLPGFDRVVWPGMPLPNVWLGVSVENQHFADERIPLLLQTAAAVRFISAEPLLGPLVITGPLTGHDDGDCPMSDPDCLGGDGDCHDACEPQPRLDWVIVGGESGAGARTFRVEWARSIIEQCKAAAVPVFMKQIGSNPISALGLGGDAIMRDRKGGDPTEWPEDLRVREYPRIAAVHL